MASLTIAEETSIKSLADGFMAGWLTTEDFSRPRRSSVVEIVLVNRMVQLFSWYLIEKLLEAVHESSPEAELEESIKRWTRVHKAWTSSIERSDLSLTSVKLLKFVVILERLKCCNDGTHTSKTFADLSKLLFCVSKFTELRDSGEQLQHGLADLCGEARALEAMHVACGGDPYTVNDQQRSREESFVNKTREIVVHIVTKRFEKPQMFMSRFEKLAKRSVAHEEMIDANGTQAPAESSLQGDGEKKREASLQAVTEQILASVGSELVAEVSESRQDGGSSSMALDGGEEDGGSLLLSEKLPSDEAGEEKDVKVRDLSVMIMEDVKEEVAVDDVEMEVEDGDKISSDACVSVSSSRSSSVEPVNLLQRPFVRETVVWSSDESCDLSTGSANSDSRDHHRQVSFPRLVVHGGKETGKSTAAHGTGSGRVRWTDEEVEFLKEGVERFGFGNWKEIRRMYKFHSRRTNVDLKDKWRNLQKKM